MRNAWVWRLGTQRSARLVVCGAAWVGLKVAPSPETKYMRLVPILVLLAAAVAPTSQPRRRAQNQPPTVCSGLGDDGNCAQGESCTGFNQGGSRRRASSRTVGRGRRLFGAPSSFSTYYCAQPACTDDALSNVWALLPTDMMGTNCQTFVPSNLASGADGSFATICECFSGLTAEQARRIPSCRPTTGDIAFGTLLAQCAAAHAGAHDN